MTRFVQRAPTFLFCVANKPKAFDERDTDKCVGGVAASGDFGEMKIVGGAKNARPSSSPTIAGQTKLSSDTYHAVSMGETRRTYTLTDAP